MLQNLYSFFYEWLFSNTQPAFMSQQGVEFTCIVMSLIVLVGVISLAFVPLKVLFRIIFRW